MSDNLTRSREIPRLTREFQIILEHYESISRTDEEKRRFVETVERALFSITLQQSRLGYGCPVGQVECPGGGCVPNGRTCRQFIEVRE
jgi:hypothetical protein